jgi:hypothetical protein
MTYFSSTPDLFSSYTSPTYDKVIPVGWVNLTHTPQLCTTLEPYSRGLLQFGVRLGIYLNIHVHSSPFDKAGVRYNMDLLTELTIQHYEQVFDME